MSMEHIRKYYQVPAKRGLRVRFNDKLGRITSARGPYLMVRLDGEAFSRPYHPTWNLEYLT